MRLIRTLILITLFAVSCTPTSPPPPPTTATVTESSPTFSIQSPITSPASISFIINVHDWNHPEESAE
ncbi:MAG TPA: hypothetical protein PL000_08145, partial [Anaerolineales bacterium]|nr:hypothetical protein [Anaerolineales bacterium]